MNWEQELIEQIGGYSVTSKSNDWEQELKEQISGVSVKPINEDWETELKKELDNVSSTNKNKLNKSLILLVLFIMLSITSFFVYNHKTNNSLFKLFVKAEKQVEDKIEKIENIEPKIEKIDELSSLKEKIVELEHDRDQLSEKLMQQSKKIGIMGIILNENFLIVKDNYDKNDIILLNREWKIKKLPKYIMLDDKDKDFLDKMKEKNP